MHSKEEAQKLLTELKSLYDSLAKTQREEVQIALPTQAHYTRAHEQA